MAMKHKGAKSATMTMKKPRLENGYGLRSLRSVEKLKAEHREVESQLKAEYCELQKGKYLHVLVTGTNSGVGFGTLCRLVDDFIATKPRNDTLVLMFTTRTLLKSQTTITSLVPYLNSVHGVRWVTRVELLPVTLELADLKSVIDAANWLRREVPKIDTIILNAGSFEFATFDFALLVKELVKDLYTSMTYPCYKIQKLRAVSVQKDKEQGEIGTVFCSNVFGHYFLVHQVMDLLCKSDYYEAPGRVIWTSSLEAYDWAFNIRDLQGLRTPNPYESSKRLMDHLVLTAYSPANASAFRQYLTPPNTETSIRSEHHTPPHLYLSHPGVCATKFVKELPWLISLSLFPAFWMCKMLLASVWHTVFPYYGAKAGVFFALGGEEEVNERVGRKIGSSMLRFQEDTVRDTEVVRGEDWESVGREIWRQMEELRVEWEARLGGEKANYRNGNGKN